MLLCKSPALLLALQLLGAVAGSTVKLINNGYEDLVIAINPAVPEDQQIIANIKDMVTDASFYLFQATQRRAYFKSAKILIPLTWASNSSYLRPKAESFHKADVIVADPFLKYGDDPYTLQYGGCGEPAKYIHFTPNFILDDTLLQMYGPRGRVFVHEWAHLRWGVFDEYSDEQPFYFSSTFTPEATRCSQGVKGSNRFMQCKGESCPLRECRQNMLTGLWEDGCMFIPERNQTTKASIMYMPSLDSVVEFCNSNTHNIEAPNLQNRMCNSRSTWDVMMSSNDFKGVSPMGGTGLPAPPTFSMLQSRNRVVCLVLDTSSSMAVSDRMDRMYQAAELYLMQIIEHGAFVGIVTFESQAATSSALRQILNEKVRKKLVAALPKTALGGRNLCSALKKAFQVNKQDGSANGTEIILLTAGDDDSKTSLCFPAVRKSGAVVHVIALGPDASDALENIATMTGGMRFSASDNLDSNDLIDAFTGISSGSGNLSQHSVQVESIALATPATQCLDKTVAIDSTVGKETFCVVTWQTQHPFIQVVDPFGGTYSNGDFISETETKTARLQIPGTAHAGDWSYHLCNTHSSAQVLSLTVTSRASNDNVPPLNLKAHMNKDTNRFPNPMIVYAEVSQGYLPVLGANVTATIVTPRGTEKILELYDSGAGADVVKNDGIYSRYFTAFDGDGRYSLKVRAEGRDKTTRRGFRMQRSQALYVPGYLENGVPQMNPLRPVVTGDQAKLGVFTRTTSSGSFVVSGFASMPDLFPPCRVTDLRARIADNKVHLSWTAPGGDYDVGQAERYEIRMSTHPLDLKGNLFDKATGVNVSGLTVGAAGSAQTFSFTPESFPLANATILYIALRATDRSGLRSDISNTAQAAMFVAPTMSPPTSPPTTVFTLDPTTPSIEAPSTDSTSRSAPTTTDPSTTATSRWGPSTELTFTSALTTEDTSTTTTTDQFPSTLTPTIKTTGTYSTMSSTTSVTVNFTFNWTTVTQAPSPNEPLTSVPTNSTSNTSVISTRTVSTPDLSPNDNSSISDSPPAPSSVASTPPLPTNDTSTLPPSNLTHSTPASSNVSSTTPLPTNDTSTPPPSNLTHSTPASSNVSSTAPLPTNDTSTLPPSNLTHSTPASSNVSSTAPPATNDTSTPPPSNLTHSTPASSNVSSTAPLPTNDTSTPPPSNLTHSTPASSNVSSTAPPPTNDTSTPPPSNPSHSTPASSNISSTIPPPTNDTSTPPPSKNTTEPSTIAYSSPQNSTSTSRTVPRITTTCSSANAISSSCNVIIMATMVCSTSVLFALFQV
ncbi:calcium-activated chloride channel regulator 1-like [Ambystoma mexicanum]|uniref:calcium-activated chloride channel regulator 1-like n=1 Tax=Ambystoma mexicanum TaxID=8296 RepID=UPI0037E846BE